MGEGETFNQSSNRGGRGEGRGGKSAADFAKHIGQKHRAEKRKTQ